MLHLSLVQINENAHPLEHEVTCDGRQRGPSRQDLSGCQERPLVMHINTHMLFYVTSNLLYLKLSARRTHTHINN